MEKDGKAKRASRTPEHSPREESTKTIVKEIHHHHYYDRNGNEKHDIQDTHHHHTQSNHYHMPILPVSHGNYASSIQHNNCTQHWSYDDTCFHRVNACHKPRVLYDFQSIRAPPNTSPLCLNPPSCPLVVPTAPMCPLPKYYT